MIEPIKIGTITLENKVRLHDQSFQMACDYIIGDYEPQTADLMATFSSEGYCTDIFWTLKGTIVKDYFPTVFGGVQFPGYDTLANAGQPCTYTSYGNITRLLLERQLGDARYHVRLDEETFITFWVSFSRDSLTHEGYHGLHSMIAHLSVPKSIELFRLEEQSKDYPGVVIYHETFQERWDRLHPLATESKSE